YSSGMNARLSFGVAININPDILILDEVLSVGDELFKRKCYARMDELFDSGCTVLYVSHSLNSINEICSRVILIDQGEQILEGPAKLVTMYYQKLLYALKEEQASVRQEIIAINKDQNAKKSYISKIKEGLAEKAFTGSGEEEFASDSKAYFIPNFVSKSTVEYKNYDVKVKDIYIKTLDGEKVNALVTGEKYIFSYKVKFNIPAENVEFAMGIRTEKGFFISGRSKQGADIPEKIKAGDGFLVEWYFRCNLLGGNYYLNIGIKSLLNGEIVFLNRIVDAFVFKVQQDSEGEYTGIVHFDQQAKITPIVKQREKSSPNEPYSE
ncbi:MAG: Wzt carbohydrate-binding domain-containing protein, partial [Candidatus Aminicenantes bacterium]|nr:Wzt carbohydrate-binding domain-containing protein [Candidatus Aminicenantes bacterium]